MRWDYGKVYKEIRQAKGLTQEEVCGSFLNRSTLTRIEKGEIIPRFDNMVFLLKQIDMTLSEFKYICNEYYPSERRQIITKMQNNISYSNTEELEKLLIDCQNYLKNHNDIPIRNIYHRGLVILEIRKNGIKNNQALQILAENIWKELEVKDQWYGSELALLANIIFYFNDEAFPLITEKILVSLDRFKNYRDIKPFQLSLLSNLSTIYLQKGLIKDCEQLTQKILTLSKELKVYNSLGFAQVRLGICQRDESLIDKGLTLLKLTEEDDLVAMLEKEVEQFYKQK
ncbi:MULTISPECIES: helix-turn-helix domain-containing protein [Streptococcus]|uniref:Helix-turn-helix domain-containing protein n=1 Tax=Streptococcus caledonicus TaxID=2614158 RepID=A0ABW0UBJ0_9STRE|nr:helix-turn-helix transcriptional regulator [Streptococcus sp. S784/96/1]